MKNEIRILGVLVFIGFMVLVLAEPVWNPSAYNAVYYFNEDSMAFHNFTINLSDTSDLSHFLILDIDWVNGVLGPSHSDFYWFPWKDSGFSNSTSGVLNMSSSFDNETGNFTLNAYAQGDQTGTAVKFHFIINATNDAPNFTNLNSSYDFPQSEGGDYTIYAADEEENYPLTFNLTFYNCTHASWSGRATGENCTIFNLSSITSTSVDFSFDPQFEDVGTYYATFGVSDFGGTCPHQYCDSSVYEQNKSSEIYNLTINVYSSLTINASNCSGADIVEGETFNCTINITTRGETDVLNFSSLANLRSGRAYTGNKKWFYGDATDSASNFFYSLPISITPQKENVGNWSINFSVKDVAASVTKTDIIYLFVNYTESNVSLDAISDQVEVYENKNFTVRAYDEDLLIQDWDDVKHEVLTFSSNTSWIVPGIGVVGSGNNYSTSTVFLNHTGAMETGIGNYSVMINASDTSGNISSSVFVVEILNESAPVWNESLDDPVILELTEDSNFFYNVSLNVSDPGENLTFYYRNISRDFCSLSSTNFNSSGIINFTPTDCGVGYHEFEIVSGNGKLNSSWDFVFNVSNVVDIPSIDQFSGENGSSVIISEGDDFIVQEGVLTNFSLDVQDLDFLILGNGEDYYNESLTIDTTFINSTGGVVDLFNFSFVEFSGVDGEIASYGASFLPGVGDVGDYSVLINVTDLGGNFVNLSWNFNITESLDAPVLENISNFSLTIHDVLNFSFNASDDEDDFNGLDLNYSVVALDIGAPDLNISGSNVFFNMSSNFSYAGVWGYNVTVNDSDSMIDWQVFYLSVYGPAWNVSSLGVFNLSENVSGVLNFTINHSVGDYLAYRFWVDNVSCSVDNSTLNCSYTNFTLRDSLVGVGNGSLVGWNFTPSFRDETYGLYKNLTVEVYPNTTNLDSDQKESIATNFSFDLNITHTNAPMRVIEGIVGTLEFAYSSDYDLNLSNYFNDEDIDDPYYSENISFSKSSGSSDIYLTYSSGWVARLGTTDKTAHEGFIYVLGNDSLTSDVSEKINIKFTAPQTQTTSGGGSSTKLKFYSIRIIVPEDVIISDEDYIEIPFALENAGTIDLKGIDLTSEVLYNNEFADDVSIDLGLSSLDVLKSGEKKDYTMKIFADTDRSGKYKATIFANVTSPKFSDWGDFFIDLRRTNESEAEELLVFTEKIIADNPECLELTEVFRRAQEAYEAGDNAEAMRIAEEVSAACEDAISANEQVRYKIEGFVQRNFYYILFVTLTIFFVGFVFYVYKRVRFNKTAEDEYIR